ncbi:YjiH family protein [Oceanimonas sp. NS1]|nr:YjiH family protein [Oceanimonas sp. NS1]
MGITRNWLMFLLPSLAGILLFMTPVAWQGDITIMIAVLAKSVQGVLADELPAIVTGLVTLSAALTLLGTLARPGWIGNSAFLNTLFNVSPVWLVSRLLGAAFVLMVHFQVGPELLYSGDTGGLVLNDLLPVLFSVFIFAGLLLPLLLDFGLLELVGTLLTRIMRPVFRLPGRSAVDCMASWLGDGSVGILLTSKQYEGKHYTQREAAVIGTTFSAVSITFSLVVLAQVKLEHMFLPFYGAVCLAGIVAAIVVPRLPPLCWKKDTFINGDARPADAEATPEGYSRLRHGLDLALNRASRVESLGQVVRRRAQCPGHAAGRAAGGNGIWYPGTGGGGNHAPVQLVGHALCAAARTAANSRGGGGVPDHGGGLCRHVHSGHSGYLH